MERLRHAVRLSMGSHRIKHALRLSISCLAIAGALADPGEPAQPAPLFNGTNLNGLYTWLVDSQFEDPRRVFSVTNGQLRISGDGLGYIGTRGAYRDYRLIVEFRWGESNSDWGGRIGKARDSGIFLHGTGPDGNSHDGDGAFMAAIECNLFQGATGDFLLIRGDNAEGRLIAPRLTVEAGAERDPEGWPTWSPGGGRVNLERWGRVNWRFKSDHWQDLLNFRGSHDLERPYGEWNRVECICRGDRIEIYINGVKANEAFGVWPNSGQILLQCEGSEIFFRRFDLVPLPK